MAKKDFSDKYELLVNPAVIVIKKPQRQRIDLRDMTVEQADTLHAIPNQRYLRIKKQKGDKNPSEGAE